MFGITNVTKDRLMRNRHLKWYRLDNAAKIFPSVMTSRMSAVFIISATLKRGVDAGILQKALENVIGRFPYYRVTLRSGLFWHYLQETDSVPRAREEFFDPCRKMNRREDGGFLFRVLYYRRKISVEFCHALTDGTGGVIFLKSLLAEYLRLGGVTAPSGPGILSPGDIPDGEEFEDAYARYYKQNIPFPPEESRAFHVPGELIRPGSLNVRTGIVPLGQVLSAARSRGLTLTEFIVSVYIYSLQEFITSMPERQMRKLMAPIRIMVPVNLRKMYPSKTMRNFFLAVKPGVDPRLGFYTMDEISRIVYHYMRVEVDEKFINQQIARNIAGETNPVLRSVPLFLKGPIMKMIYNRGATSRHSGVVTNIGAVSLPAGILRHVERIEALPNPNPLTRVNVGVVSYNKSAYISFVSFLDEADIEKFFFRNLVKQGIRVRIESN